METKCPKCKDEDCHELVSVQNNPNLISCRNCGHVYFVELKLIYRKAYEKEPGCFSIDKN
ncbi:hypothetical protein BZG01_00110 [Labilibaculum manganireducens]|uniref:Uncharacterized protein n=1 Tax=Labilibaculum manganireducens TaxID=1940525 RepID=A0A2N3IGC5_9BACT|nr:hypothetical protein [Labilibaculum manganireducens]PKQ69376.1 hypothetical protein BZG01_00110 [Labilibaculum manganireducens]